jgi:hypothetical protein
MKYKKFGKAVIVLALFWGSVLAIGGAISGNQVALSPNLQQYENSILKEKLSQNALNCWISNNRSNFRLVEFTNPSECSPQFSGLRQYVCLDSNMLKDTKQLRKKFRKLDRQLIVYNAIPTQNLKNAALLKHYGYNVRMLDNAEDFQVIQTTTQKPTPMVQPVQQPAPSEAIVTNQVEETEGFDNDDEEEEEEEEEEGC